MPVNTVAPYVPPQNTDDLRKTMDDPRSKGQPVNTNGASVQAQTQQNATLTPQAIGPAVRVDISNQARQVAGSSAEKTSGTKKEDDQASAKKDGGASVKRKIDVVA